MSASHNCATVAEYIPGGCIIMFPCKSQTAMAVDRWNSDICHCSFIHGQALIIGASIWFSLEAPDQRGETDSYRLLELSQADTDIPVRGKQWRHA